MKKVNRFLKGIGLPGNIYRVIKYISIQKKFLQQNLAPVLQEAFKKNDGSLDQADVEKINRYYGLAVPAILGEAFCALRGNAMTFPERWASTCQGAMTGLFDDFFDKDYLPDDAVEKLIDPGNVSAAKRSNQQLFDLFYKNALQHAPDNKHIQETLREVYKAQVESKKQKGPITKTELTDLTFFKGGSSVIFYRAAFSPAASAAELKLLYNLGGLMQLANDIFDVYKDREAGIKTLLTETKKVKDIRAFLSSGLREYYQNAFEIGFPEKNVRAFLNIISIGIFSRCFVCLQQMEENEKLTGNEFDVQQYSRKQLICDMDTKMNMLRAAWSHINDIP
ncbi:MAG: hypothetical protein ABI741_10640 [Ferruginibacter sp.]